MCEQKREGKKLKKREELKKVEGRERTRRGLQADPMVLGGDSNFCFNEQLSRETLDDHTHTHTHTHTSPLHHHISREEATWSNSGNSLEQFLLVGQFLPEGQFSPEG